MVTEFYVLITTSPTLNVPVDGVVFVYNVDGFALDRELYMNRAPTIVGWYQIFDTMIAVLCAFLLLLLVGLAILVLQAVLADIIQPSTIAASLRIEGVTLGVLETIRFFDGRNYRPISRQLTILVASPHYLLGDSSFKLQPLLAVKVPAQCILDLNTLRITLGLNQGVEVDLLCHRNGEGRGGCKNEFGHYI